MQKGQHGNRSLQRAGTAGCGERQLLLARNSNDRHWSLISRNACRITAQLFVTTRRHSQRVDSPSLAASALRRRRLLVQSTQLRLTLSLEQLGSGASYYSAGSSLPDSRCPPVGGQKPAGKRGAPALQRLSGAEPGHPPLLGSSVAGLLDLGGCAKASCVLAPLTVPRGSCRGRRRRLLM